MSKAPTMKRWWDTTRRCPTLTTLVLVLTVAAPIDAAAQETQERLDLATMFELGNLVLDTNGDSVPDLVNASLVLGAAAQKRNLFLCVQDLSCPGASFLHSVSLAAHIPNVTAIEGNSRQYCPAANAGWRDRFPEVFRVKNGKIQTDALTGPGLGFLPISYEKEGLV